MKDYVITVTGEAGITIPVQAQRSFTLTIRNPCINSAFVTINQSVLVDKTYQLYSFKPSGFSFNHSPFTVATNPISHTLCGDLVYTSTFMSVAITGASTPLSYSASTLTHTVYSEDITLKGTSLQYTVKAAFVNYPTITSSSPDAKANIQFLDPCPTP